MWVRPGEGGGEATSEAEVTPRGILELRVDGSVTCLYTRRAGGFPLG